MATFNYTSGSSADLVDFYDKLCNFLTGANGAGWFHHYTSSSSEKVFVSSGSDNRLNGIIKLKTHLSGIVDSVAQYQNVFSHVFAEGFNRFNQDTGVGEFDYGPRGPMLINLGPDGMTNSGYVANLYANCLKSFKKHGIQTFGSASTVYLKRMYSNSSWNLCTHDGHKYFYGTTGGGGGGENTATQGFVLIDMFKDTTTLFVTGALTQNTELCNFYNTSSGEQYAAVIRSSTPTAANSFAYYRIRDLQEQVVAAPWSVIGQNYHSFAWNGSDKLYVRSNSGSMNVFYIPTNTFTTLSNMPASFTAGNTVQNMDKLFFVQQNLSTFGTLSSSNVLYMKHGGVSSVYTLMYNINADTWHSRSDQGAIVTTTNTNSDIMTWDSHRNFYMILTQDNNNYLRKDVMEIDLQNHQREELGMLTNRAFIKQIRLTDGRGWLDARREIVYHHNFPKVRVNPTGSTNYWFLGNRDNVVVVTQPHTNFNGHFVMSFGRVDSFSTRPSMLVTEANSATGSVVLKVDNNNDYSIGETLTLFDKNSNNPVRRVSLIEKYGSSYIRTNTPNQISVGTLIGDNSCNTAIYDGDDEFLTTNEQPISASCFDGLYNCDPLIHFSSSLNGNYSQNMKQNISSMCFYQGYANVDGDYNIKRAPMGFVRNIFTISSDENKSATAFGHEFVNYNKLVIDGKKYLVFKNFSKEMLFRSGSNGKKGNLPIIYDYVIGPFGDA